MKTSSAQEIRKLMECLNNIQNMDINQLNEYIGDPNLPLASRYLGVKWEKIKTYLAQLDIQIDKFIDEIKNHATGNSKDAEKWKKIAYNLKQAQDLMTDVM